jgi:hypothetical protein
MKPLGTLEEMGDLLEITEQLDDPGLDPGRRDFLLERLRRYATATGERITALHAQLTHAEDLAVTLRVRLTPKA